MNIINTLKDFTFNDLNQTGEFYFKEEQVKIRIYYGSIKFTDLTNAGKRAKTCLTYTLFSLGAHNTELMANFARAYNSSVSDLYETLKITDFREFTSTNYENHSIQWFLTEAKGVHVVTPFADKKRKKVKIHFEQMTEYTTGAILVDSWGYEQTNIEFFGIIKRKGDWLTVQKLKKESTPTTSESGIMTMVSTEVPTSKADETARPIRKKIVRNGDGAELGFSFRNYSGGGWCKLWKGNKVTATHYA